MSSSVDITKVNAGILSEAAYTVVGTPAIPSGWLDITADVTTDIRDPITDVIVLGSGYSNVTSIAPATDEFRVFINTDHQIVIAFKGSNNLSNFQSDLNLSDQGASAYNSIASKALAALKYIRNPANGYSGDTIFTDGHSLGGGMAQTFALQNNLSGFGQNSLPIPPAILSDPSLLTISGVPLAAALKSYQTSATLSFTEVNVSGDPATNFYAGLLNEATTNYLSLKPTTLASPYAAIEAVGAALSFVTGGLSLIAAAAAAGKAHSILTVNALAQDQLATSTSTGTPDSPDVAAAINALPGVNSVTQNSNGSETVNTSTGSYTASLPGALDNSSSSKASVIGNAASNSIVEGGVGNDALTTNFSGTLIIAGTGNDTLNGSTGNDTLVAGLGNATLEGGVGDTYVYVLPISGSSTTETINATNASGNVYVGNTQLTGGTMVAGSDNTWTDSSNDQYQYLISPTDASTGTLTITQGLLGSGGNQIIIDNFDMYAAQNGGYLGIKFGEQLALKADASATSPFATGIPTNQTADVPNGDTKTFTIYASSVRSTDQIVQLALSGGSGSYDISTGANLLSFGSPVNLVIRAGQDHATFTLVDLSNTSTPDTAQLTASFIDSNGTVIKSNNLTVTFDDPALGTTSTTTVTPDRVIIGDLTPKNFGTDAVPLYHYDDLGNLIIDPGNLSPNRNDSLNGSTGNDIIDAGGGDNYINATQGGNDTITSGSGKDAIFAGNGNNIINSGDGDNTIHVGNGNNTVTGGAGNDIVYTGNGNNIINGKGGQDIVLAGGGSNQIYANQQTDLATAFAQAQSASASGKYGSVLAVGSGNNTLVGGTGNDVFALGGGNDLVICGPGNDTIMGGEIASSVVAGWTTSNSITVSPGNTQYTVTFVGVSMSSSGGYTGPYNSPNEVNVDLLGIPAGGGSETIFGGSGNNYIGGSNGNGNYIDVGSGNSTVFSGGGNDTIFAGTGNSTISGQAGNDVIVGESGNDSLYGGAGNNTIFGGSGNDTIIAGEGGLNWADLNQGNNYVDGGSGNSIIYGTGGNDTLLGGTGNATIYGGNGNQYIVGGSGNVSINGGNGNDTIYAGGNGKDTIYAGSGHATIYGGDGTDSLVGGAGVDLILAGDGGTTIAPTQLYAWSGTSSLYGGAGVDQLFGGSGNDTLIAGTGTSTLQGGTGTEVMYGSIGNATLIAGTGADTLYGGGGTDVLQGTSGNTQFVAGSGNEKIYGGSGSNTYQFNTGFGSVELGNTTAADTFQFGTGISLADLTVSATLDSNGAPALLIQTSSGGSLIIDGGLDGAINQFAFANGTVLTLNQLMALGNTVPTTTAGANGNLMFSASGADALVGGTGNDTIYGWNSNNTLVAGSGDQTLISKSGNDTLIGGTGNDTFVINSSTDLIQAQSTGTNVNTVLSSINYVAPTNVQNLTLTGTAALTATGNTLSNVITTNSGNDTLIAGAGLATMIGGAGNDTFVVNNINDVVQAQSTGRNTNTVLSSVSYVAPANVQNLALTGIGDLVATGNSLVNVITANSGNDTLIAGAGLVTMVGGTGNDTFVVNNVNDVVRAQSTGSNTNTVVSSVSYVAPANVQNLTLTGTTDLMATGNNLNNVISANSGNDTLTGGSGSGTLVGGTGLDTFVLGSGMGSYTAIKQASANAVVQIGQGLSVSDVTATQSGNDFVLSVGPGGGLRLKDYFLDPSAWTIQDTLGSATTAKTLLDATALAQSNLVSFLEHQYLDQVKAGYIQQLVTSGYVLQSDGSWYMGPLTASTVQARYQIQNDHTTYIIQNLSTGATSYSSTSQTYKTWTSDGFYISDRSASIQQTTIDATAPVIYASGSSGGYSVTSNPVWLNVNWSSLGSPYYTSNYSYPYITSSGGGFYFASKQWGTLSEYSVHGTLNGGLIGAIQSSPGTLSTNGPFPQLIAATFTHLLTTDLIQQINVGVGNHTVYASGSTLVNSSSGNDTIYNAGFAYSGTGNDTMLGGGTLMAGTGNDLLIGGSLMIAGSGNDSMFAAQSSARFLVNANNSGVALIGGGGSYTSAVLNAFYVSQGISNWWEGYTHPDLYSYVQSNGKYTQTFYVNATDASSIAGGWGLSLSQALSTGRMHYISPLPVLAITGDHDYSPAAYYATSNTPQVSFSANDFQSLAPYYAQGVIPTSHVELGAGIALADLTFSWGVVIGSISGSTTVTQLRYTTLNISTGLNNPTIEIMIPHSDDQLGSGVTALNFADGTKLNMTQLIAMAPPAPTFDPQICVYQPGMGVQVLGAGYNSIQFGTGITSSMISLGLGSLMLRVGTTGDVIHITQFDPTNALAPNTIQKFSFADGTVLSYNQLLTRGFDIYGTIGDETLTGTNLNNRIYAGSGRDTLIGSGANDSLIAGAGLDTLIGGKGNETFVVNNAADVVQAQAGAASNTVLSSVSYISPDNVRNLTLTGTADLTATGNSLNNVITANSGNDTLIAGAGLVTMVGGTGNDTFVVNNINDVVQAQSTGSNTNTVLSSVSYVAPANVQNITLTGTTDLIATGNNLNNVIIANSGNDTLIAGSGFATIIGGTGNDTFVVNNINDVVQAQAGGINIVQTSVNYVAPANVQNLSGIGTMDLTLSGNSLTGVITANSGNDTLVAGSGIDTLIGGLGNDTFVVNNAADIVQAQAGGINTVLTSVSYVAPANVQNLTGTGTTNLTLTGNTLNDIITANSGNDILVAGSGDDTLVAGSGIDTLIGGLGNDTFVVNNVADVVQAQASAASNSVLTSVSYVASANVQNLTGTGTGNLRLTGNSLTDVITANSGNDTLVAGSGIDTLIGGIGNDTFVVNNTADVVQAQSTGSNTNTVLSSVSFVAPDNVKNLTGTGSANLTLTGNLLNDVITANSGNDSLVAGSGNDTLISGTGIDTLVGGTGNDTFVIKNAADVVQAQSTGTNINSVLTSVSYVAPANVQNLTGTGSANLTLTGNTLNDVITANSGNDILVAGSGNDTLISGTGIDTLVGGTGNDTFVIKNAADVVQAQSTGTNINSVLTSVSYVAPANVQNLTGTGSANLTLTGNTLNDVITANSGNDSLVAGSGNDTLISGTGIDILVGGTGNDTFVIKNAADVVQAQSTGTNINSVLTSVSYVAPANVQNLTGTGSANLTLTGNTLDNVITANSGNDTLVAGSGIDTLVGGVGNDTFTINNVADVVQAQFTGTNINTVRTSVSYVAPANVQNITGTGTLDLTLTGNSLNGVITANSGNDTLVAGLGIDTLKGGIGNDTFVVNNINDVVQAQVGGTNSVLTSVSFVASANVQNLTGTGILDMTLTGNNLADVITANSGNDTLISGTGIDTLVGGTGNDTFVIKNAADVVQAQSTGTNINSVLTSVSYVAPANVQNLTGTGSANLTLTGNTLDNVITANSGNDTLVAGSGIDTLVGGIGNDTFTINNVADVVQAQFTGTNINTVRTSVSYVAPANVQNITGTGTSSITLTGNSLNGVITANSGNDSLVAGSGNDTLISGTGIDTMIGGIGNDTFIIKNIADVVQAQSTGTNINTVLTSVSYVAPANIQNITGTGTSSITLTGNSLNGVITANSGKDTLIAGSGIDTLIGGTGNDTFVVNNVADVIQAQSSGTNINSVLTSVSYVAPANVQNLTGTGSANLTLTGNTLNDLITANSGNDSLVAGSGNDTLVSGTGIDTLVGGTGNDTFVIKNAADVVQAQSTGTNINTVLTSVSYVAPSNVQNITGTGSANLTLTGNTLDDFLLSNSGNDTLVGGSGVDVLEGGVGLNKLTDTAGIGAMLGLGGNDTLTGGAHNDFLAGGMGNDTYTTGASSNVIGFNKGDGADVLNPTSGATNTLSLGGGVNYTDLSFSKSGNNLILTEGTDTITFTNWYAASANQNFVTLQVIEQASSTYDAASSNALYNQDVVDFSFSSLVNQFNAALTVTPTLTTWSLMNGLLNAYLSGSNSAAMGGDLAYYDGLNGSLSGMNVAAAQAALKDTNFGTAAQATNTWSSISGGAVTIH